MREPSVTPSTSDDLRSPASAELRRFARLARHLAECGDRSAAAQAIADAAVSVVGCDSAAVAHLVRRDGIKFELPGTGPGHQVRTIARIVRDAGEGPAADAVRSRQVVRSDDLTDEPRWPTYAREVTAATPVRTVLAYPLYLGDVTVGALVLYDTVPGFFDAARRDLAEVYADHATIALARAASSERADHLERALRSNRVIGQAVGIVMTRYRITEDDAFDVLRLASQATSRKLRDIAADVVEQGDLPPQVRR